MSTATPSTPAPPPSGPPVVQKTVRPLGVVPRHLQTWFVTGIAGLIVIVMFLTGRQTPSTPPSATPAQPQTVDPNQARINEYRNRVEEQARRLQAEQAELALTKQALAGATRPNTTNQTPVETAGERQGQSETTLQQDQAQREYRALYADNLAWTRRPPATAAGAVSPPITGMPQSTAVTAPGQGLTSAPVVGAALPATAAKTGENARTSSPNPIAALDAKPPVPAPATVSYPLLEGTIIETVLINRLDGSYAGPVIALVTTPVYARDFQHLLVPRGTRLLGAASPVTEFGQQRLAVVFHRLVFPDGRVLSLERFPGLNQVGDIGLRDQVNNHYLQIFGASLAIGALAGFAQHDTGVGLNEPWTDAYRQGVSTSLTQSSMRILDRFLNRLPTVTIREGHRIKVYLSADLSLPEYVERSPRS